MSWDEIILSFVSSLEGEALKTKVSERRKANKVYPDAKDIFKAFRITPIEDTVIVILGLDPYINDNHAHGLAFSSKQSKQPDSLKVIFKELRRDLYHHLNDAQWKRFFPHNDLTPWAKKGILLLNRYYTVDEGKPKSHKDFGWDWFNKHVFEQLNNYSKPIVFMFWGNESKEFAQYVTNPIHLVLEGAHPDYDVNNPDNPKFHGCGHFKQAVDFIKINRPDKCKSITLDIRGYFKDEMYSVFLKEIKTDSYPFLFKDDREAIEGMREALKLTYNYGFDFTLNS